MTDHAESRRPPLQRRPRPLSRPVRYVLVFVTCALVLNALLGESGLLATLTANRHYSRLAESLEELRKENDRLREEVRRLREDPTMIEELARRDLGMIRPGERLFIVPEPEPVDESAAGRSR